ncbi:MAG TPA: hypothetical protein VMW87_04165 [Spirochaetia bacterium]|nr:hypothetical protein [Spirochaetia bacterium]
MSRGLPRSGCAKPKLCAIHFVFLIGGELFLPVGVDAVPGIDWEVPKEDAEEIGAEAADSEADPISDEILQPGTASLLFRVTGDTVVGGASGERTAAGSTPGASRTIAGRTIEVRRTAFEQRASYRSDLLDVALLTGARKTSGEQETESYAVISVATDWLSAGRFAPPYLFHALATSYTASAGLERMSPAPPFLIPSDLPSFTASAQIMHRLIIHPFGDLLAVWGGSNATGCREAAGFLRLRPTDGLTVEAVAAAAAPEREQFAVDDSAWFPDSTVAPRLRAAGGALGARLLTRPLRVSGALFASGGPFADPGAAAALQLDATLSPLAFRLRAASASDSFRQLESGAPRSLFAADGRAGWGDEAMFGFVLTGALTLDRPADVPGARPDYADDGPVFARALRPGPGRPGRERWGAAVHAGPQWFNLTFGGRFDTDWPNQSEACRSERAEVTLRSSGSGLLEVELRARLLFQAGVYDQTEGVAMVAADFGRFGFRAASTLSAGAGSAAELTPTFCACYDNGSFALSVQCDVTRGILLEPPRERQRREPVYIEGVPLRITISTRIK